MTLDRAIMAFAGCFILLSLLLAHFHSSNWLWFTALIGVNLFQSAFTGFCPMAILLKKIGIKPGSAF